MSSRRSQKIVDAAPAPTAFRSDSDRALAIARERATFARFPVNSSVEARWFSSGSSRSRATVARPKPPDHLPLSMTARPASRSRPSSHQGIRATARQLAAVSKTSIAEARRLLRVDMVISAALGIIGLVAMASSSRSRGTRAFLSCGPRSSTASPDVKNPLGAAGRRPPRGGCRRTAERAAGRKVARFKRLIGTAVQTITGWSIARVDAGQYSMSGGMSTWSRRSGASSTTTSRSGAEVGRSRSGRWRTRSG